MADSTAAGKRRSTRRSAVMLASAVIVVGLLVTLLPYLATKRPWISSVADAVAPFPNLPSTAVALPPHERGCMSLVTVAPNSRVARFEVAEGASLEQAVSSLSLLITAPGYRVVNEAPGLSNRGRYLDFLIRPPHRALLAGACLINDGSLRVLLRGTTEARTISRSAMTLNGKRVGANLVLLFRDFPPKRRLSNIGNVLEHVANLTDGLVPPWLVWVLALATLLAVPAGTVYALDRALREPAGTP